MSVAKNISQFEDIILKKYLRQAISSVANIICAELRESVDTEFYQKYEPKIYHRTNDFLSSATRGQIVKIGNEMYVEVYIDYENKMDNYEDADGEFVATLASMGFHGNIGIYRPFFFWNDFLDKIPRERIIKLIKQELSICGVKTT